MMQQQQQQQDQRRNNYNQRVRNSNNLEHKCIPHSSLTASNIDYPSKTATTAATIVRVAIRSYHLSHYIPSPLHYHHYNHNDHNNVEEEGLNDSYERYGIRYRTNVTLLGMGDVPLMDNFVGSVIGTMPSSALRPSDPSNFISPNNNDDDDSVVANGSGVEINRDTKEEEQIQNNDAITTTKVAPITSLSKWYCSFDTLHDNKGINSSIRGSDNESGGGSNGNDGNSSKAPDNVLDLPARWCDLPRDAVLQFTIVTPSASASDSTTGATTDGTPGSMATGTATIVVGVGRLELWSKEDGILKSGLHKVHIVPPSSSSSSCVDNCQNNDEEEDCVEEEVEYIDEKWEACLTLQELDRATQKSQQQQQQTQQSQQRQQSQQQRQRSKQRQQPHHLQQQQQSNKFTWLDNLTRQRCIDILHEDQRCTVDNRLNNLNDDIDNLTDLNHILPTTTDGSKSANDVPLSYLIVELPDWSIPVVHGEIRYPTGANGATGSVTAYDLAKYRHSQQLSFYKKNSHVDNWRTIFPSLCTSINNPIDDTNDNNVNKNNEKDVEYEYGDSLRSWEAPPPYPNGVDQHNQHPMDRYGLSMIRFLDPEDTNCNPYEERYNALHHPLDFYYRDGNNADNNDDFDYDNHFNVEGNNNNGNGVDGSDNYNDGNNNNNLNNGSNSNNNNSIHHPQRKQQKQQQQRPRSPSRSLIIDPSLRPNKEQRKRIDIIVGSISNTDSHNNLTNYDKDLLWMFRYALLDNDYGSCSNNFDKSGGGGGLLRKACKFREGRILPKLLKAIRWNDIYEVQQMYDILKQWDKSGGNGMDGVADALALLGGDHVSFRNRVVSVCEIIFFVKQNQVVLITFAHFFLFTKTTLLNQYRFRL